MISEGDNHVDAAGYKNHFTTGIMILILVIVVIFGIVAAVVMIRQIKMPLLTLTEIADRMALGEADVEINKIRDDEIGKLSDSMKRMIENIKMQNAAAQEIAVGNLQIEVKTASEKDILSHTLKKLVADNNEALGSMKEATLQVASGAEEVASASQSLAQGSTEQASAIQQITASIDEIANRTKVNAQDANEANKLVESAKSGAVRGNERMNEMIKAMEEINESSFNISKIMKVIDDIAFQTNILALNAAVEAARAGQHGKGFAVVADEVRSLAGKSAQAASETAELIEDSIKKVGNGSKLAEETAAALNEIVQAIDKIVTLTSSIASASNEQATAVTQIDQAISQVSQVVQTNSSTSEEFAAASEQLSAQAEKLKEMIGKYRLKEAGYGRDYYSSSHTGSNTSRPGQKLSGYLEAAETPVISLEDGFGKY